jgi:phage repressor protein C with HTH and peptisase S24 domain
MADFNVNRRLKKVIEEHYKMSPFAFSQKYGDNGGVKTSAIIRERNGVSSKMLDLITAAYPEINRAWLLTGEGEMLKSEQPKKIDDIAGHGKLIPFYDAEAAAGNNYEMDMMPSRPVGMIEIGSVLRDCESAIRVYGNSMVPNYPAGCVIGLKLHTDSFIEPGRVYVVETRDNRYLKRLYYTKDKKSFHCLSDNTMKYEDGPRKGELYYQDFEIPIDEVVRLHRVVGVIKRNIL